ncbi:unnamed protein product, partial [Effrenium voratum]
MLMDPSMAPVLHLAVSLALEFAWFKQVVIAGRPKKVWSQAGVRPALQDLVKTAVGKIKARLPLMPDGDCGGLLQALTSELKSDNSGSASAAERAVASWLTEAHATTCLTWVRSNGRLAVCKSKRIKETQAFAAALTSCKSRVCSCGDDTAQCAIHDGAKTMALSDMVWLVADGIFEHIPAAVPQIALAVVVKISGGASKDNLADL